MLVFRTDFRGNRMTHACTQVRCDAPGCETGAEAALGHDDAAQWQARRNAATAGFVTQTRRVQRRRGGYYWQRFDLCSTHAPADYDATQTTR